MNQFFINAVKNWKSTVQGFLTVGIALGTYFSITPSNVISTHAMAVITLVTGAAKVVLSMIQKD